MGGVVEFGEPIGAGRTIYTLHSELLTFGESFGCDEASFRLCLSPDLLSGSAMSDGGGPRPRSPSKGGGRRAAVRRTISVHLVEATEGGRSVRVRAVTEPIDGWGLGGGIVSTAAPAAATVRMLAQEMIDARGALPPQRCIDPKAMFAQLEQRGCSLRRHDCRGGRRA